MRATAGATAKSSSSGRLPSSVFEFPLNCWPLIVVLIVVVIVASEESGAIDASVLRGDGGGDSLRRPNSLVTFEAIVDAVESSVSVELLVVKVGSASVLPLSTAVDSSSSVVSVESSIEFVVGFSVVVVVVIRVAISAIEIGLKRPIVDATHSVGL